MSGAGCTRQLNPRPGRATSCSCRASTGTACRSSSTTSLPRRETTSDDRRIGLVWDGSGSHRSTKLVWPDGLKAVPLPPYSPELNPAEQVMRVVRDRLANQIFVDLDELDAAIEAMLHEWWDDPSRLQHPHRVPMVA